MAPRISKATEKKGGKSSWSRGKGVAWTVDLNKETTILAVRRTPKSSRGVTKGRPNPKTGAAEGNTIMALKKKKLQ